MGTDFQLIAQLSDSDKVHKLYINQSMNLQTSVMVQVEKSGMYQITIFTIGEETGILNSNLECTKEISISKCLHNA